MRRGWSRRRRAGAHSLAAAESTSGRHVASRRWSGRRFHAVVVVVVDRRRPASAHPSRQSASSPASASTSSAAATGRSRPARRHVRALPGRLAVHLHSTSRHVLQLGSAVRWPLRRLLERHRRRRVRPLCSLMRAMVSTVYLYSVST